MMQAGVAHDGGDDIASDAVWNHTGMGRRQGVAHLLVSRNHVPFPR
jgi:hypothetical protein